MKTVNPEPTKQENQTKEKESPMKTILSDDARQLKDNEDLVSHRTYKGEIAKRMSQPWQYSRTFEVLSSIIVVIISMVVLKVTGLNDAMDSTAGKIGLGAGISWYFLVCFRFGLYAK